MSSVTESNLGLNYGWAYGESGWNTGMDDNLVKLGFTSRNQIKGILSAPPSTPSNGDAYIVGTSPTGLFSGNFGKVAIWDRTVWLFLTPKNHEVVYNVADGCDYKYDNGWSLKQEGELSPYVKVKDFTFSTGYTITDQKQGLLNLGDNKYYQWFGAIPKVVPAGSTPATAGGIGALLWVDRTDLMLRSELLSTTGASIVGRGTSTVYADLTALEIKNANTKTTYVTDFAGCYTDIGAVINTILTDTFALSQSVRIVIPYGLYTNVTAVSKTVPSGLSVEILMHTGSHVLCDTDQNAFTFTATDSSCAFHLGGHGRISAHFGVNSATATCLKVVGFSFPKSMVIDGAMTIGTSELNTNWKTALHIVDCDSVMVYGMYIQDASTLGTSESTAILIESLTKQVMDCKFIDITTGGHKYYLRGYNSMVGTGLEGIQLIDCSLSGSGHIENLVSLALYQPPQIWYKGCHINNMTSHLAPITVIGFNDVRFEDCTVFTYDNGLAAIDSCSDIVVDNVDLYWIDGANGDAIYLASSNGVCSNLYVNRLIDHSESATGAVVHMSSANINTITIKNSKKKNLSKPWLLNDAGVNWSTIEIAADMQYGVSAADLRLLQYSTLAPVGAFDASNVVGEIVLLTSAGTISSIINKLPNRITFVCEVSGQEFIHNALLLLAGATNATATAGTSITFVHQGAGVYREVSRTF